MEKIRVVLADDQVLFVESLKNVLKTRAKDIDVVGIAHNGAEAVDLVRETSPDLVLMDVRMPTMDGVAATRAIRKENDRTLIVMLTTFDDDDYVHRALEYGAVGYLLKDIPPSELIASIRALKEGAVLVSPSIASKLLHLAYQGPGLRRPSGDRPPQWVEELTTREREILSLIAEGKDNREIANDLSLAEQTVKNAVSIIYAKLGVKSRVQAVTLATQYGLA